MSDHPVIAALRSSGRISDDDLDYIEKHGRPYRGSRLPSGLRLRGAGKCFTVSDELEADGWGRYVTGIALPPVGPPKQHAWVSKDGRTVIDATWPEPHRVAYLGFDRRHEARIDRMMRANSTIRIPSFG
ncbi:hypothetical protein ASF24_08230 [Methylobacterium sp. Leaf86]|uniref:hypothetical protein n=1 Tax=Methylobacterium sp. Leaf86 TaxID=1736242 RepID=UPI0006FC20D3|nr:hypothetical protein [Methylobacterium sp. Leaf86]KQO49156.1 hypothetical protein ASF24_08230 [Methylobacterium sp. Leaf86]